MMHLSPILFSKWVEENESKLRPPVNNWCVHEGEDFIVMAVGGPNERSDYHVNDTEEWFYQVKGDMLLKIVDASQSPNEFIDQHIKEGEMFLLPPRVPHNPVRFANTIGIVIERRREKHHNDKLRWYCRGCRQMFYEETFHCVDIQTQLKEIIMRYANAEALRTCKYCGYVNPPQ